MIHNWFLCKIRYDKMDENGVNKKVTEPYLVDALSFAEAEARIIKQITPFITGEFAVADIKREHYSEVFTSDDEAADKWFAGRLAFITIDEVSSKEKRSFVNVLAQAGNLRAAMNRVDEGMKGTMADYKSMMLKETAIVDIYPYEVKDDKQK